MTPEQTLILLHRRAVARLRIQLAEDLRAGNIGSAVYRRRQITAARAQLAILGRKTRAAPIEIVAAGYDRGAAIVDVVTGKIRPADVSTVRYAFNGVHTDAPKAIAANLAGRVAGARDLVGRRVDDFYRQAALETVGEGIIGGQTRREVSAGLERRLIHAGLTGFVDKRGAQWQLDTYAEMAARTTTREAMTAGTRGRMTETGQDLVTISDHSTETEICQQYEGKTYSLTGDTPGYDVLPAEPPFHPRCLHVMTPAADNLDRLLAELGVDAETGSG